MLGQIQQTIEYQIVSYLEEIKDEALSDSLNHFAKDGWQVINCQSYKDYDGMKCIRFILQRITQMMHGVIDRKLLQ